MAAISEDSCCSFSSSLQFEMFMKLSLGFSFFFLRCRTLWGFVSLFVFNFTHKYYPSLYLHPYLSFKYRYIYLFFFNKNVILITSKLFPTCASAKFPRNMWLVFFLYILKHLYLFFLLVNCVFTLLSPYSSDKNCLNALIKPW